MQTPTNKKNVLKLGQNLSNRENRPKNIYNKEDQVLVIKLY